MPTEPPDGTVLAAISERHDPSDVLVSADGRDVDGLADGATVATGSLRRRAQLLHRRPDLRVVEIRGNVETRVRKMRAGDADAIVLARAGLERLGLAAEIPHAVLPPDVMLPAVGQGFLAAATLTDHPLRDAVREALNDPAGEKAALAERAMLSALEGGCRVPVGALAVSEGEQVRLRGLVASPDGALMYEGSADGKDAEGVGERLARDLLEQGAEIVLGEIREVRS